MQANNNKPNNRLTSSASAKINNRNVNMANSMVLIMVATLISKLLGFLREMVTSNKLGASRTADIYIYCTMITVTLFSTIFEAIRTTYIPNYSSAKTKNGTKSSLQFSNNIINIVTIITIIISLAGFLISPFIISVFSRFRGADYNLAVYMLKILFTSAIFQATTNVFVGYLQANGQFFIPGIISLPYNICIILPLLFYDKVGVDGLLIGSVLALAVQPLFLLPFALKKGYRYSLRIYTKDEHTKNAIFSSFPIMLGGAVQQINAFVDKSLASSLVEGSIAALNYSNKLMLFVFSMFSISVSTIIFPNLSAYNAKDQITEYKNMLSKSISFLNIVLIPSTAALIILSRPIIMLLFEHGKFDATATTLTSGTLIFYSLGILFYGYRDVLNKAFYSVHDTKTPMINAVLSLALTITLNFILIKPMQANGLALASSVSAVFTTILLFFSLRKKIGAFGLKGIFISLLKSAAATAIFSAVLYFGYDILNKNFPKAHVFYMQFLILAIIGIVGIVLYFFTLKLLKSAELEWGINMFKSMLAKRKNKNNA